MDQTARWWSFGLGSDDVGIKKKVQYLVFGWSEYPIAKAVW